MTNIPRVYNYIINEEGQPMYLGTHTSVIFYNKSMSSWVWWDQSRISCTKHVFFWQKMAGMIEKTQAVWLSVCRQKLPYSLVWKISPSKNLKITWSRCSQHRLLWCTGWQVSHGNRPSEFLFFGKVGSNWELLLKRCSCLMYQMNSFNFTDN